MSAVSSEPLERRKFQLTDLTGNNNKFYLVEIWPQTNAQFLFRATYGRVGARANITEKIATRAWIDKKINEKIRKGYQEVVLHRPEVTVVEPTEPVDEQIDPAVKRVVDWIYFEARENIASFLSVGLDALSPEQIERGRKLLNLAQQQHETWQAAQSNAAFKLLAGTVQSFYNAVPTKLPARIKVDTVVENFCGNFSEQEDRLNQLEAALATEEIKKEQPLVSPYAALGAELEPLSQNHQSFGELVDYIQKHLVHGYKVSVKDIFSVCIPDERRAWSNNERGRNHSELLFHGTAGQNVRHIMRTGLMCPRTASHGRMFGHGIYFANRSSKSINYCSVSSRHIPHFMFLAEVALGNRYIADDAMSTLREPPKGYDSVWGKAGHTGAWGGQLQFDEFIVYSATQQTIRYLVTFDKH